MPRQTTKLCVAVKTAAARKKSGSPPSKYVEMIGLKGGVGGRLRRSTRYNQKRLGGLRQPNQLGRDKQDLATNVGDNYGVTGGLLVVSRKSKGGKKGEKAKLCKVCGKRIMKKMNPTDPHYARGVKHHHHIRI